MLASILKTVQDCLAAAGVPVQAAYAALDLPRTDVVVLGLGTGSLRAPGVGDYLGASIEPNTGAEIAHFGCRVEVELCLDCYSETDGAACLTLFQQAAAALGQLAGGLRLRQLRCGEAAYDRTAARYHCRGLAQGMAYLTASAAEDGAVIRDYTMRGVITHVSDE